MMKDLTILQHASGMLQHATQRNRVIAENVANADTPGYRARTMAPFDPALAERRARGDSVAAKRMVQTFEVENISGAPNGNTVELEDQMAHGADAMAQHDAALAIYRKTLELMRTAIRAPR